MNIRTSLIAIGAILALIAPAAASARAIVNQKGDTYFTSKHGSHALVNSTSFVSENGHFVTSKLKARSGSSCGSTGRVLSTRRRSQRARS